MNERFAQRADEFIARIRRKGLGPGTELTLVYDCVDVNGQPVEALRVPIEASVRVDASQGRAQAEADAEAAALQAVVATIEAEVRRAPNYPVLIKGGYSFSVLIRDFALEI
jgi:hypothetical protein